MVKSGDSHTMNNREFIGNMDISMDFGLTFQ